MQQEATVTQLAPRRLQLKCCQRKAVLRSSHPSAFITEVPVWHAHRHWQFAVQQGGCHGSALSCKGTERLIQSLEAAVAFQHRTLDSAGPSASVQEALGRAGCAPGMRVQGAIPVVRYPLQKAACDAGWLRACRRAHAPGTNLVA